MKLLLLSLVLPISFTIVLVSQTAVFAQTEKRIEGEGGKENNLAVCLDYFMNMNGKFTENCLNPNFKMNNQITVL